MAKTKQTKQTKHPLVGRKIADVLPMTAEENEAVGFDRDGVIIWLDDNSFITAAIDPEINGPGQLLHFSNKGKMSYL